MKSTRSRRTRGFARSAAGAATAGVALAMSLAATPASAQSGTEKWETFGGACDGVRTDVMPVVGNGPLAPFFLSGNRTLVPYWVVYHVFGDNVGDLKTRHFGVSDVPVVKSGPMPANLVTCEFEGVVTAQDGQKYDFTATAKGLVHGPATSNR